MNFNDVILFAILALFLTGTIYVAYDHQNSLESKCKIHGYVTAKGRDDICVDPRTGVMYIPQYLK